MWPKERVVTDKEKLEVLWCFLQRVNGYGYLELSYMKIEGEYRYFHRKARELMEELFPEKFDEPVDTQPVNMDF